MLSRRQFRVSRRRIGMIMSKYSLVSNYTLRHGRKSRNDMNNDEIANVVERKFDERVKYEEVVVSDLTYIKIAGKWHYLCVLLDLCGRKILGSAVGTQKNAKLVETAFYSVQTDLRQVNFFHTDRAASSKTKLLSIFWTLLTLSAAYPQKENHTIMLLPNLCSTSSKLNSSLATNLLIYRSSSYYGLIISTGTTTFVFTVLFIT
jgi:transposase-like protein